MFNLASWIENPFIIIAFIVLFFGVIALIVFLLRKLPSLKDDVKKPMSEEEAAKENLDRILVPIEEEKKSNEENEEDEGK
ncbi:MAG: hypothetical protein J1F31_02515 [Erysipelotrichales bacterium]|nr:hypothetical protein [Erysipelotrichales bacterium]